MEIICFSNTENFFFHSSFVFNLLKFSENLVFEILSCMYKIKYWLYEENTPGTNIGCI